VRISHRGCVTLGERVEIIRSKIEKAQREAGVTGDKVLTRPRLAQKLGLDRSAVTKWATGEGSPRDPEAVARAMGVTVAELYAGRLDKKRRAA